jgi:ribonuclease E
MSGDDRDEMRETLNEIGVPEEMGLIVRTAGVGRSAEELKWDMDYLLGIWEAIKKAVVVRPAPFLIFQDSNAIIRALRDHLANDVGEILIDDEKTYEEARQFVERAMPQNLRKLRHYTDQVPLFTRFQIESQIESAFSHNVDLPSGGSLVIDHTEALVSIDINSARATKGGDIEATAFATNLEAADEIARQLRLRDLGGLIVIDFIDMGPQRNQRDVENRLRDAVRMDRARVQIGKISRFGLLEMSRQRLRPSLGESAHQPCPRCNGMGSIRSVESLALAVLRLVGEETRKDRTSRVIAQLPVAVANYLLNEKREWIRAIEARDNLQVILVANPDLETPNYSIRRVRDDQLALPENSAVSYQLVGQATEESASGDELAAPKPQPQAPAVASILPVAPAPAHIPRETATIAVATPGLLTRLRTWLFGSNPPAAETDSNSRDNGERRPRTESSAHRGRSDGRAQGRVRAGLAAATAPRSSDAAIARHVVSNAMARAATATRTPTVNPIHARLPNRATMTAGVQSHATTITVAPSRPRARTRRLRAGTPATNSAMPTAIAANGRGVAVVGAVAVAVAVTATTRVRRVPATRRLHPDRRSTVQTIKQQLPRWYPYRRKHRHRCPRHQHQHQHQHQPRSRQR